MPCLCEGREASLQAARACAEAVIQRALQLTGAVLHAQGLNIAPALITVSPTKTAINPVGPLKVSDAKVTETLPALPVPDERS